MAKQKSSIEEQVEYLAKKQIEKIKFFTKTETINSEIEEALKSAPSKKGGEGMNYPDIKLFLETKEVRHIPVMIEVKGLKGKFLKENKSGEIENKKADGTPNYSNINGYAVNGAIHYANVILDYSSSYKEVIAIGINGYLDESKEIITELGVYYVSKENFNIPKKIGNYSDITFLLPENLDDFIKEVDKIDLTPEEIEIKAKEYENEIEVRLKKLNQTMQDTLKISVGLTSYRNGK